MRISPDQMHPGARHRRSIWNILSAHPGFFQFILPLLASGDGSMAGEGGSGRAQWHLEGRA
jgi:hypothetical protein